LLHSADRRVTRINLDLHDGPLQDLSLLLAELSTFEHQLELLVPDKGLKRILQRRISDLTAIATAVDSDLREIAAAGGRAGSSLRDTLERVVSLLERRRGIDVRLCVEGDVERTTPSQRIAVARVVEEALVNIREHSHATEVEVTVRREEGSLSVSVSDNGIGFNVARANRRAARERRLGLAVMGERARLIGGRLHVNSRPGGPTTISASLPAWEMAPRGSRTAVRRAG
jgi:signal transduction histidine kinase